MDNQISKTTQGLTTAADMRETTQMLMKPHANWEEYLTPAPLSIAIMGELVFISSCTDFSINKNPPKSGFKYILYPESFRACLMQICNAGWDAFNEAHKNMDQIRLHTATVPEYMKTAINTLFNASDAVIEKLLPSQLDNIDNIAKDCVILASSVEKKYRHVIDVIQELLEACINADHFYGEELEKVKMKLKEAELREKASQKLNEQSKKMMEAMSKQMDEAREAFKSSMDSLPSGWDMIGMDFVEGITSSLTGLMNGLTSFVSGSQTKEGESSGNQNTATSTADPIEQMRVLSKSGEILNLVGSLKQYVSENEIDWKNLYDQKKKCVKTTWTRDQFQRIVGEIGKMSENIHTKTALSLCKRSIALCEKLQKYTPEKVWDKAMTEEVLKEIKELYESSFQFDSQSKSILGSPALAPKPPMMYKESSGNMSASQRASENARFRIEQSREQLNNVRASYEKSVENMEKNQKELNDILVEMQNCKIKEIDFETTIKMLGKGLDAMGKVKVQWEKMLQFFQMVSNIVQISLSKTMQNFVITSDKTRELSYNDKLYQKDMLYNQAFQASNISSLVHMISGAYTEVSNKYLMDRVSSLGMLMAMDKSNPKFEQERQNLQRSCQEAQDGILELVRKNRAEYEKKSKDRMAKIEGALKAILPAAQPKENERIKEIVQAGFGNNIENYI